MSGICGIINFDGAPVDPDLLRKMALSAAHRGPDGIHYWIDGNVGMAHLALHTTPESVREHQPLLNERGNLILTADARIDNREEIASILKAKGHLRQRHPTDADFIMAAYEFWGEDCPEHIVGDFAFAIWDITNQSFFAARDQMGVRLLYYRYNGQQLQWATEARQFFVDPTYTPAYNETLVAQDLVIPGAGGKFDSYYAGIKKIGPAYKIKISDGNFHSQMYWDFSPDKEIRFTNENDYVDNFSALFRQTIRARMRSVRPVGIFMSGGIDSTSVAAVAAQEMQRNPAGMAPGLEAVNWTVNNRHEYDETERSRAVVEKWGFGYREVDIEECWPMVDFPDFTPHPDNPYMPHLYHAHRASLSTFAESNRPNVWMNGYGADMAIGGFNLFYYIQKLKNFQWNSLLKEIQNHQRTFNISYNQMIKDWILGSLVTKPAQVYLHRVIRKDIIPDWLDKNFVQRTELQEWVSKQDALLLVNIFNSSPQWKNPQKNLHYRRLTYNRDLGIREWYNRFLAAYHSEITCPWDDIRLTEYLLAIPSEQIAQGVTHKLLLRKSLKGILPDIIRERFVPRSGTPLYMGEQRKNPIVVKKACSIIEQTKSVQLGWVTKSRLDEIVKNKTLLEKVLKSLWSLLLLEMWLQTSGSFTLSRK